MKDFARTAMGRRFFEEDMPNLIRALNKIADNLEKNNLREDRRFLFEQKIEKQKIKSLRESSGDFRDNVESQR